MYYKGLGVPQDDKEAVKWWKLAAEQGNAIAQYNLALRYDNGLGVPQNHKEAFKWFRLAAEQGGVTAQSLLGLMYHHGQGVPQDYLLAHMWYNLAGSNGGKIALRNRNKLEKEMTPSQIEKAQEMAINWKPKK